MATRSPHRLKGKIKLRRGLALYQPYASPTTSLVIWTREVIAARPPRLRQPAALKLGKLAKNSKEAPAEREFSFKTYAQRLILRGEQLAQSGERNKNYELHPHDEAVSRQRRLGLGSPIWIIDRSHYLPPPTDPLSNTKPGNLPAIREGRIRKLVIGAMAILNLTRRSFAGEITDKLLLPIIIGAKPSAGKSDAPFFPSIHASQEYLLSEASPVLVRSARGNWPSRR